MGEIRALVTYYSESGNTQRVAEAIYDGIVEAKKDILPLNEAENTTEYDMVFCGFPVHAHSVPAKAAAWIQNLPEKTKIAFFATHGSLRGGELAITAFHHALGLATKLTVLGTFGCRGNVKSSIIEGLMKKAEHRAWAQEAQGAAGHPDPGDLDDAKDFADAMITKARSL